MEGIENSAFGVYTNCQTRIRHGVLGPMRPLARLKSLLPAMGVPTKNTGRPPARLDIRLCASGSIGWFGSEMVALT